MYSKERERERNYAMLRRHTHTYTNIYTLGIWPMRIESNVKADGAIKRVMLHITEIDEKSKYSSFTQGWGTERILANKLLLS